MKDEDALKDNVAYQWYITNWEGQETESFVAWWRWLVVEYHFEHQEDEYWIRKGFALAGWRACANGTSTLGAPLTLQGFLASVHRLHDKRHPQCSGLARPMARAQPRRRRRKKKRRPQQFRKFSDGEPRGRLRARRDVSPLGTVLAKSKKDKSKVEEGE